MYCLTVLEAGSPRLRCQQDWFLLRAVRENLFHALLLAPHGFLAIFGVPWLVEESPVSTFMVTAVLPV